MTPLDLLNVGTTLAHKEDERRQSTKSCREWTTTTDADGEKRYCWTIRVPGMVQRIRHFAADGQRRFFMICITDAGTFAVSDWGTLEWGFSNHRWVKPPTDEQMIHLHILYGDLLPDRGR